MRKSFFLTLLLTLCCTLTAWAEFNPTPDKAYALKERTSGLYLDILNGVDTSDDGTQRNISLSSTPCEIYLEKNDQWTWFMKNSKGEYIHNKKSYSWNPEIAGTTKHNDGYWFFVENENGYVTIGSWNSTYIDTLCGCCWWFSEEFVEL